MNEKISLFVWAWACKDRFCNVRFFLRTRSKGRLSTWFGHVVGERWRRSTLRRQKGEAVQPPTYNITLYSSRIASSSTWLLEIRSPISGHRGWWLLLILLLLLLPLKPLATLHYAGKGRDAISFGNFSALPLLKNSLHKGDRVSWTLDLAKVGLIVSVQMQWMYTGKVPMSKYGLVGYFDWEYA